jgi:hypothetical protein
MARHHRRSWVLAGLAGGAALAAARTGRRGRASPAERRRPLPGDDLVPAPFLVTTHAATLPAPPEQVWPWLVQMGYHRGGWYTYPWVDRLFRISNPSADHIIDELQDLAVGDIVPDGEPGTAWYVVDELAPARHLVLRSTTHLPPSWRREPAKAWMDWTWAFVLEPAGPAATRLIVRVRGAGGPGWFRLLYRAVIVPGDAVMSRSLFAGLARRVGSQRRT